MTQDLGATEGLVGRRILVVEDEPLLADELMDELLGIGAGPIGPVPSVDLALQALADGPKPDAALLNVYLRGAESFPVADDLIKRGVPFLFVTGNDAFVRQRYPTIPVHPKPSDMPLLLKALSLLVGSHSELDRAEHEHLERRVLHVAPPTASADRR